jgi:signal transduction histidine kinase
LHVDPLLKIPEKRHSFCKTNVVAERLKHVLALSDSKCDLLYSGKIDIVQLIDEVIAAHIQSSQPDVHLTFDRPSEKQQPLFADARLLRVVLSNLVSNAQNLHMPARLH